MATKDKIVQDEIFELESLIVSTIPVLERIVELSVMYNTTIMNHATMASNRLRQLRNETYRYNINSFNINKSQLRPITNSNASEVDALMDKIVHVINKKRPIFKNNLLSIDFSKPNDYESMLLNNKIKWLNMKDNSSVDISYNCTLVHPGQIASKLKNILRVNCGYNDELIINILNIIIKVTNEYISNNKSK